MRPDRILPLLVLGLSVACSGEGPASDPDAEETTPQDRFWQNLGSLCGQSYEGRVVESEPPDPAFDTARLVMHVRGCSESEIRIPFHAGDDRSRTWVISRTAEGLRLKHVHRHEDGVEDAVSRYGGDTRSDGSAHSQSFHADALTAELIPAAATNVWTVEIHPGIRFIYALERVGTDRRFRAEFDLSEPVPDPPPPWGD